MILLDLRHERNVAERAKQAASRQDVLLHIDFFLLIVSMGHSLGSQIEPVARLLSQLPRSIEAARVDEVVRPVAQVDRHSQGEPGRSASRPGRSGA